MVPPSADLGPQAVLREDLHGEGEGALLVVEADERAALPREGGGADLAGQPGRGGLQPGALGRPAHPPAAHDQKLPCHRTPIVRGRSDRQGDGGTPTRFRSGYPAPIAAGAAVELAAGTLPSVDVSPEIYENMAKALAILTARNESGDGDLSLVERTTLGYLDSQPDPDAKVAEAINLVSGLVSLGGRMLLQLAQTMELSEDELLRIMGERIAYRT